MGVGRRQSLQEGMKPQREQRLRQAFTKSGLPQQGQTRS